MSNQVKFKHFVGTISAWQSKLESDDWKDSIVFAKVWENISKDPFAEDKSVCTYKICAGKSSKDLDGKYFVYEFPSFEDLKELEDHIKSISDMIAIDEETGTFSSETFVEALNKSIEDYLPNSQVIQSIDYILKEFADDIDNLKFNINNITQHISWKEEK